MQAGKLNRRIQVQAQTSQQDAFGQPQQSWSTVYEAWANIDIQGSQLLYSTAEFVEKATHRITLRWTPSTVIEPQMRIVYTEPATGVVHTYEIQALLNPDQRNRTLIAMCYELNAQE